MDPRLRSGYSASIGFLLLIQYELHRDLRLHGYRRAIQVVRPILPLIHSFYRSMRQDRRPADDLHLMNRSVRADQRPKLDDSLQPDLLCNDRIQRLDSADQVSLHHDRNRWWLGRRRWIQHGLCVPGREDVPDSRSIRLSSSNRQIETSRVGVLCGVTASRWKREGVVNNDGVEVHPTAMLRNILTRSDLWFTT